MPASESIERAAMWLATRFTTYYSKITRLLRGHPTPEVVRTTLRPVTIGKVSIYGSTLPMDEDSTVTLIGQEYLILSNGTLSAVIALDALDGAASSALEYGLSGLDTSPLYEVVCGTERITLKRDDQRGYQGIYLSVGEVSVFMRDIVVRMLHRAMYF